MGADNSIRVVGGSQQIVHNNSGVGNNNRKRGVGGNMETNP